MRHARPERKGCVRIESTTRHELNVQETKLVQGHRAHKKQPPPPRTTIGP